MLTKININGFRGFKEFNTEFQQTNVLVGPNNIGKTTLLQAVRFACATLSWMLKDGYIGEYELSNTENTPNTPILILAPTFLNAQEIPWLPLEEQHDLYFNIENGLSITLSFSPEHRIKSIKLDIDDSGNISASVQSPEALSQVNHLKYGSKRRKELIRKLLQENEPIAVFVPVFSGVGLREEYRTAAIIDRMMASGQQSQIVRNLVARLDGDDIERLNILLQQVAGVELSYITPTGEIENTDRLKVYFKEQGIQLELASAGAGLSSLVAIFSALLRYRKAVNQNRPVLFLLDEPEAHLHPRLQGEAGMQFADLSQELGTQLFIATHSVEMINRLAKRTDTALLVVDKKADISTNLTSEGELLDELGRWCDLTPFASLQLLKFRRILFHEGPSDGEILRRCAEVYFYGDQQKSMRFAMWSFAPLAGVDNAGATDVLKRALQPLLSIDSPSESVFVARVLDRDYRRTPKIGPEQSDKRFRLFDVVWSRHSIESLFLDAPCLHAWIYQSITHQSGSTAGISEESLSKLIGTALLKTNSDDELLREATSQLLIGLCGTSRDDRSMVHALREADKEVRSHPEVWQRGRDRAKAILGHMRDNLPLKLQNRVRRDIQQLVTKSGDAAGKGDAEKLIPEEIRKLLDYMVSF